ncbi:uncharacterized protein MELLADRAFT_95696 [Melampsora larici-populina 98AG31]|uniref:Glutamate pyruvate transaminase n=1 Tax=Melampsora larici-populina (strain 98AG31 / pathotype 3-4-7) TaxID=747676 RepID=F4SAA5_MELLP|nr:uncharacterized protein MELLADRAFT_95696 [Melampsora larici-populina 98AG31]EGF98418.1 hypothetical protein MELLADRAFT_95696 [Melampsora larici-populina 98AG31]
MLAETTQMTTPNTITPSLSIDNINPAVVQAQYAVRGEVAVRAEENNIGNPQDMGQKPITFNRQVAALTELPSLMDLEELNFPTDVVQRAKELLEAMGGSIGAYSASKGLAYIRGHVAEFLAERDGGVEADPELIYLTTGASSGVKAILQLILASEQDGVMIPIPQYPLYSATLALQKAHQVPYQLLEEKQWEPDLESLEEVIKKAAAEGTRTRAMVLISPGNPVGNVLSLEAMNEIIRFCASHNLVLIADEVYQANIANHVLKKFVSFKRALSTHPDEELRTQVPLVSLHSISKGQTGECGRRGGFLEIVNFPKPVQEQLTKLASIDLCPPIQGQIGVDVLVRPPKPGEPSYKKWYKETRTIQKNMNKNAAQLSKVFQSTSKMSSSEAQGAMYLFPQIELPKKAIEAAQKAGKEPDLFYCLELLERAGICVVPGSGFGQAENTTHFRTTFLGDQTDEFVKRFTKFHAEFLERYKD